MRTIPADVIDLVWEEPPDVWYVRGHQPEAVAIEAVRMTLEWEAEEDADDDPRPIPELGAVRHTYARWGIGQTDDGPRVRQFFCPAKPGRGAFPVTEVCDLGEIQRRRDDRAAQAAHAAELEELIRQWLPEATELVAHGYPPGEGLIRFKLPGLVGDVRYSATDPKHVMIQEQDRQAWTDLYKGRPTSPAHPPD